MREAMHFLNRLRLWWLFETTATLLLLFLRLLAAGIPLLLLYVWADVALALPEATRQLWNLLLPALLLGASLFGLRPPGALEALALRLDRARRDPRRTIACAHDLCILPGDTSPLHETMRAAAVAQGSEALRRAPLSAVVPFRPLLLTLVVAVAAAAFARAARDRHPEATRVALSRLRNPSADIAPWTPLHFEFLPENPSVVYGEDIQLGVRITNGELRHPVTIRTRVDGVERESGSYREGENVFSQRLEQVTQPVEYAFFHGRVRSEWREVTLQTLPRITAARVTLTPPAYTGRPATTFAFGERNLTGLPGTHVALEVESNRPLSGGELKVIAGDGASEARVTAEAGEGNQVRFQWYLETDARLEARVRDIRGGASVRPLAGNQRLEADRPPRAHLVEPQRFLLATPGSRVPVKIRADDDIGVTRVTLVRGLSGFIDRARPLWEGDPIRRKEMETELDLGALGVEPGQVLELYVEARDHRPGSPATGVSDLAMVHVITEEEYAIHLRNRERIEGFRARFAISSSVLEEVGTALLSLRELLAGEPDIETVDAALTETAAVLRRAEETFRQLGEDFPIYDIEGETRAALDRLRGHFAQQAETLESLSHRDADLELRVESMAAAFAGVRAEQAEAEALSEAFLRLGELFEQTVAFQRLIQRQEELERQFGRHAYSLAPEDRERLQQLGERQRQVARDLRAWMEETRKRADALPGEHRDWADQVEDMLSGLEAAGVEEVLEQAAGAAANEAHRRAWELSRAALEILRPQRPPGEQQDGGGEGEENPFAQMCRGGAPFPGGGGGGGDPLANSLEQLLQALRNQLGQSQRRGEGPTPGGSGGGPGGFSDDGYAVRGSSALNIPLLGPNRHHFNLPRGQEVDGVTFGTGGGTGGTRVALLREGTAPDAPTEDITAEEIRFQEVPERYREAIRRYFNLDDERSPQ